MKEESPLDVLDSDESIAAKPVMFFGKDVREIKCFRESFIRGVFCGIVGGLGCFLFTSKVQLSTFVSIGSLWAGVFSLWIPCRYKYETSLFLIEAAKQGKLKVKNPKPNSEETTT